MEDYNTILKWAEDQLLNAANLAEEPRKYKSEVYIELLELIKKHKADEESLQNYLNTSYNVDYNCPERTAFISAVESNI